MDLKVNLTKNFTLEELVSAGSAHRLGGFEQFNPTEEIVQNLRDLCRELVQPVRDAIGHALFTNSGYRSKPVNKGVKGAKKSDHLYGRAIDCSCTINGRNCNQLIIDTVLALGIPFKQMIDEFGTEDEPAWVHLSFEWNNNRREILRARKVKNIFGKMVTKYTKITK